jgi:DNA invertase Pin-like site-specific DNA recombinase
VGCDHTVGGLASQEAAERRLAEIERLGACPLIHEPGGRAVTNLDDVRAAREAAEAADRAFRRTCIEALKTNPTRQVAIAAGKTRQTIYNWAEEARP